MTTDYRTTFSEETDFDTFIKVELIPLLYRSERQTLHATLSYLHNTLPAQMAKTHDDLRAWAAENGYICDHEDLVQWAADADYIHGDDLRTWAAENGYTLNAVQDLDDWATENGYIYEDDFAKEAKSRNYIHEDDLDPIMSEYAFKNGYFHVDDLDARLDAYVLKHGYIHEDDLDERLAQYAADNGYTRNHTSTPDKD